MNFLKKILWGACLCFLSQVTCARDEEPLESRQSRRGLTHGDRVERVNGAPPERTLRRVNACSDLQSVLGAEKGEIMANAFLGGFLALFFMAQSWGAFTEKKEGAPMQHLRRNGSSEGVAIERESFRDQAEEFSFNDVFGRSPPTSVRSDLMEEMGAEIETVFPEKKKKKKKKGGKPEAVAKGEAPSSKGEKQRSLSTSSSSSSVVEDWLEGMDD